MAIIRLTCALNGGDLITSNANLTYRVYGSADAFTTPIATLGSYITDPNVTVNGDVVVLTNIDVGAETTFKVSSVDSSGNEALLSNQAQLGGFDPSYQAILDYADSNGITKPSVPQQIIQNQLVLDLKSNGIWDRRYTFWMPANDGSAEFATLNWKNPALHRWTHPVGDVPFVSNVGFRFNAADQKHIDTGFNWAAWLPTLSDMNDVGVDWAMTNAVAENWGLWGHRTDSTADASFYYETNSTRGYVLSLNSHAIASSPSNTWQTYYRDSLNGRITWYDGVTFDHDTGNGTTIEPTTTVNIPIGTTYRVNLGSYGYHGWFNGDINYFSIGDNMLTVGDVRLTMKTLIEGYLAAI